MPAHEEDVQREESGQGTAGLPAAAGGSVLDALRKRREQLAQENYYDVEVPGYDGLLVLRMGVLPNRQLQVIRQRAEASNSPDAEPNANADLILQGCTEVLARSGVEDDLAPLDDEVTVRVDARLAELLQLDGTNARATLRALFAAVPSPDLAIGVAAGNYVEWMQRGNREADEALLGES